MRLAVLLAGSGVWLLVSASLPGAPSHAASSHAVSIEMRDVHLRVADDVALDVAFLNGSMLSRTPESPPVFDDGRSYVIDVDTAEISIDRASLNALVNRVFSAGGSALRDVHLDFDGGLLRQTGHLHKGVSIPFTIKSRVSVTTDGRLRLHPESVKAVGVPVGAFMNAFGVELSTLVKSMPDRGVEIDGDDVLLAPGKMVPPPEIRGRLTRAEIRGDRLVQTFGTGRGNDPRASSSPSAHYIWFRGGSIRFGRLTMTNTDMKLIDADPRTPFDFYPAKYKVQLVAGYSKNTPDQALRVYMPDYATVSERPRVSLRPRVAAPQTSEH